MSVLVVGNAAIDRIFQVDRLPAPGETMLAETGRREFGGKGLNQAVVAARAGAQVRLVAAVGGDLEADEIAAHLDRERVHAILARQAGPSDELVVIVGAAGENTIISTVRRARSLSADVVAHSIQAVEPGGILLVQGNLTAAITRGALACARERRLRRIANAAPVAFDWRDLQDDIDVLVMNEIEALQIGQAKAAAVIVTEGAAGATLLRGQQRWYVPAPAVAAVDTTAAGDVLCGMLVAALDRELPLLEALARAVRAAALKVGRPGTSTGLPSAVELQEILT